MVAAAIVIYGLLDFFVFSKDSKNGEEDKIAAELGKITAFAESAGSDLTAVTVKKEFPDIDYLIAKAESKWENDPFIVYDSSQLDETLSTEKIPDLFYTGFIKAGKKVLAIVNGQEYTLGEMIKDVGYKVSGITPSKVVLLTEFNKEIILQLEEN